MKKLLLFVCFCSLLSLQAQADTGGPGWLMRLLKLVARSSEKDTVAEGKVTRQVAKQSFPTTAQQVERAMAQQVAQGLRNQRSFDLQQVARTLEDRNDRFTNQALKKALQIPRNLRVPGGFAPAIQLGAVSDDPKVSFNAKAIYPLYTFLHTGDQEMRLKNIENYLVSANNREYVHVAKELIGMYPRIKKYVPVMQRAAALQKQPADKELWLAKTIPADTQWLFLGEHHAEPIWESIERFLPILRQQMPNREIIICTEFLPRGVVWTPQLNTGVISDYLSHHEITWEIAYENNMQIVGLEKKSHRATLNFFLTGPGANGWEEIQDNFPGSLEGMRLRNQSWMKMLKKQREEHPDALIIVYAGAAHVERNFPYNLSKQIGKQRPDEKTFVANFYLEKCEALKFPGETECFRSEPLEEIYRKAAFPQAALYWENPVMAELAGYDARLKIPQRLRGKK